MKKELFHKSLRFVIALFIMLCCVFTICAAGISVEADYDEVIACRKDTYIFSGSPNTDMSSYNVQKYNMVLADCWVESIAVVEFDLTNALQHDGEFLQRVMMQIKVKEFNMKGATAVSAYAMQDGIWPNDVDYGSGLTYNNAQGKSIEEAIPGSETVIDGKGVFELDVTEYIRQCTYDGRTVVNIAIKAPHCVCNSFHSITLQTLDDNWGTRLAFQYTKKFPSESAVPVLAFETVAALREAGGVLSEGDVVRTNGYHKSSDGGGAVYDVVKNRLAVDDGGSFIHLGGSLYASLRIDDEVNIRQFGAYGDGLHDDSVSIQAAFDCSAKRVIISPGEYKANSRLALSIEGKEILGQLSALTGKKPVIFTDSDYNDPIIYWREFFLRIMASDVSLENVSFETREVSAPGNNKYNTQVGVFCDSDVIIKNISILNCSFIVNPEAKGAVYNNLDLYTGWRDVLIDGCEFMLDTDARYGTCLMARDLWNRTAGGLKLLNSSFYKVCQDEILWIFGNRAVIDDIVISGNSINVKCGKMAPPAVIAITVGSDFSTVENVLFSGNTVESEVSMSMFNIGNVKDMSITKNDLTFKRASNSASIVFNSTFGANENLAISDNQSIAVVGYASVLGNYFGSFTNNDVTIRGNITGALFCDKCESIDGNRFYVYGNLAAVTENTYRFTNNQISVEGYVGKVFQYFGCTRSDVSLVTGNTVSIFNDNAGGDMQLLMINYAWFNGFPLMLINNHVSVNPRERTDSYRYTTTVTNNIVVADKETSGNLFYYISLLDTERQTLYIYGNTAEGFRNKISSASKASPLFRYLNPLAD